MQELNRFDYLLAKNKYLAEQIKKEKINISDGEYELIAPYLDNGGGMTNTELGAYWTNDLKDNGLMQQILVDSTGKPIKLDSSYPYHADCLIRYFNKGDGTYSYYNEDAYTINNYMQIGGSYSSVSAQYNNNEITFSINNKQYTLNTNNHTLSPESFTTNSEHANWRKCVENNNDMILTDKDGKILVFDTYNSKEVIIVIDENSINDTNKDTSFNISYLQEHNYDDSLASFGTIKMDDIINDEYGLIHEFQFDVNNVTYNYYSNILTPFPGVYVESKE